MQIRRSRWLAVLAVALAAGHAAAQAPALCTVSAQSVVFGAYDPLSSSNVDAAGAVIVSCVPASAYTISLSPGAGSYAARAMINGPHRLGYNLYVEASRTTIWGDGTGGSASVSSSGAAGTHTVYGRIPASQNVNVGSYSDTITVTLNF